MPRPNDKINLSCSFPSDRAASRNLIPIYIYSENLCVMSIGGEQLQVDEGERGPIPRVNPKFDNTARAADDN